MKYAEVLRNDFIIPKSSFWLKKDLEKNPFELLCIRDDDTVMDCGAYCGTFSAAALEQGASKVFSYEANAKNAAVLRENMKSYGQRSTIIEAALVATLDSSVALSLSGFSGAHSIIKSANRPKSVQVSAVNFRNELLRIRPEVLKLDVEAAEYDLLASLKSNDLASVNSLFIEFHPTSNRDEKIEAIHEFIKTEGLATAQTRRRAFISLR